MLHVEVEIAQDRNLARRRPAFSVARQRQKIDFGRKACGVERAQQIGGEDEAALQDRDDEQIFRLPCGDLGCKRL